MTFAQFVGGGQYGSTGIIGILNTVVVPVIFALAFLVFVWGVINHFFIKPTGVSSFGERGGYAEGRQFILWGLIGMIVLFSVWGLVNLLLSTLGFSPGA